ncbi:hypothetical protein VTN96DRAFT_8800 [Rasamsonia emersonii]
MAPILMARAQLRIRGELYYILVGTGRRSECTYSRDPTPIGLRLGSQVDRVGKRGRSRSRGSFSVGVEVRERDGSRVQPVLSLAENQWGL